MPICSKNLLTIKPLPMKRLRNILAITLISVSLFSCDSDYIQDKIDQYKKEQRTSDSSSSSSDTSDTSDSTGGEGDDSTDKDS